MDRALISPILIVLMLTILNFAFNWINKNFNYNIEEHADSSQKIKDLKEKIITEILNWKSENNLTIVQTQERLGINNNLIEDLTNRRLDGISIGTLINLLFRTGKMVSISISA